MEKEENRLKLKTKSIEMENQIKEIENQIQDLQDAVQHMRIIHSSLDERNMDYFKDIFEDWLKAIESNGILIAKLACAYRLFSEWQKSN